MQREHVQDLTPAPSALALTPSALAVAAAEAVGGAPAWCPGQPVCVVWEHPLAQPSRTPAPLGVPIAQLEPRAGQGGPHLCRLNGQWLSRADWWWPTEPGDVIEWHAIAGSRNTIRGILTVAVAIAAIYYPPLWNLTAGQAAAASVAISVGGNLAINALLPLQLGNQDTGGPASPTFNVNLSGNQARLYQPIPKVCGTHLIYPNFAAQPYFEFENNDQYYKALLTVGVGQHDVIRALIDDTDLSRFQDVLVARYLPPGTPPIDVLANVVSAPEVGGAELKTGRYIGGFAACGPRSVATRIGIDIVWPRGLSNLNTEWRVEARRIDDFGAPITAWSTLGTENYVASTNTAQRRSYSYTVPAARYEVRVVRLDVKDETPGVAHELQWVGLRAYLGAPAPLNPAVAHYEIVLRASEQLSSIAQRRIALLVAAHCRTWDPTTGWSAPAANRNPFWWLADLWSSTTWGEGLPDARIDLATLRTLALQADERQDRFDYVFDSTVDAWEAAQLIARAGRARVFRRGGVYTCARDELATLPVTAFSARNCLAETMSARESLRSREAPDGIIVEYFDNRAWDWREISEPLPGVTEITRPIIIRLPGVTGLTHAQREAQYEAAAALYRTRVVSCVTEMEGMLPAYLQPVLWQPDITGYGSTGDVTAVAGSTLTLSEPVPAGATQIWLLRDDGSLFGPVAFTSGAGDQVTLATAPDFTVNATGGRRDRTRYLIGAPAAEPYTAELVRIAAISDGGKRDGVQYWRIDAAVDDDRVHTADEALLPVGAEVQDPIDTGAAGGEGGDEPIVNLANASRSLSTTETCSITLRAVDDGNLRWVDTPGSASTLSGQWLLGAPWATTTADDYEIRATLISGTTPTGSALGTWLPLGTAVQEWTLSTAAQGPVYTCRLLLEVRVAASGAVQDSGYYDLSVEWRDDAGGDGG